MTFVEWMQIIGPVFGALVANFFELRKLRVTIGHLVKVSDERHEQTIMRLDGHEQRIGKLELHL
jgi:cytosine/uracil/thiamine/allantoin permease